MSRLRRGKRREKGKHLRDGAPRGREAGSDDAGWEEGAGKRLGRWACRLVSLHRPRPPEGGPGLLLGCLKAVANGSAL